MLSYHPGWPPLLTVIRKTSSAPTTFVIKKEKKNAVLDQLLMNLCTMPPEMINISWKEN